MKNILSFRHFFKPLGYLLLLVIIVLFSYFVAEQSDVLASVFASTLTLILSYIVLASLGFGLIGRGKTFVQSFYWSSKNKSFQFCPKVFELSAQVNCPFIPPLFALRCTPVFEQSGAPQPHLIRTRKENGAYEFRIQLSFPHRGDWKLHHFQFSLEDQFGLTRLGWTKKHEHSFRIAPEESKLASAPPIFSASRPGEGLEYADKRQGDFLDLKPYHPADGVKRLSWKIFARTRELVTRQPEKVSVPDEEVVLFSLGRSKSDRVLSKSLLYMMELEREQVRCRASCLGAGGKVSLTSSEYLELLIDTAFSSEFSGVEQSLNEFLASEHIVRLSPSRIALFVDFELKSAERDIFAALSLLERKGLEAVLCGLEPQKESDFLAKGWFQKLMWYQETDLRKAEEGAPILSAAQIEKTYSQSGHKLIFLQ
jgi:hypothetical protein